jgi:hypothetical protein
LLRGRTKCSQSKLLLLANFENFRGAAEQNAVKNFELLCWANSKIILLRGRTNAVNKSCFCWQISAIIPARQEKCSQVESLLLVNSKKFR